MGPPGTKACRSPPGHRLRLQKTFRPRGRCTDCNKETWRRCMTTTETKISLDLNEDEVLALGDALAERPEAPPRTAPRNHARPRSPSSVKRKWRAHQQ